MKNKTSVNTLVYRPQKALMQKLLTGKKRLPGFEGMEKEVGKFGEKQTGNLFKVKTENWNNGKYLLDIWYFSRNLKIFQILDM